MTEIYHVLNRGVDKRTIFLDEQDHFRFIHDLYEFNNEDPVLNFNYFLVRNKSIDKSIDVRRRYGKESQPRKLIVDIHAFCLMPNHYHLMISPRVDKGIPLFMKKLNGGYAKYFNEKYERSGALFQGRYKSIVVTEEHHFIHLPYYIHCNPLDIISEQWRAKKMNDRKSAINFLESYRWSSHLDYLGKKNFPSVISDDFLQSYFGGKLAYKNSIYTWLKNFDSENVSLVDLESIDVRHR